MGIGVKVGSKKRGYGRREETNREGIGKETGRKQQGRWEVKRRKYVCNT
jgi:hypothetical protein